MRNVSWIHVNCVDGNLQFLFRRVARWKIQALTVPPCMSHFEVVTAKSSTAYTENGGKHIPAAEVKSEAISLPREAPDIIPLLRYLPESIAEFYQSEREILTEKSENWEKMRNFKAKLGMSIAEYKKIVQKLLDLKMIKFLPLQQVKVINGIQCVTKAGGKQRLIFDGRPVNLIFKEPEKVELPDFSLLEDWQVGEGEVSRFGKLDLDNFYHRLGVPEWMSPYLALPALNAEDFGLGKGKVCPACLTLPMGLAHAVFLAQQVHLFILRHSKIAPFINIQVHSSAREWALIYIDDLILGVKDSSIKAAEDRLNLLLTNCLAIYKQCKLVINREKIVYAAASMSGLGCHLSSKENRISPNEEKAERVVSATRFLLQLNTINAKQVEVILGHWVWFFLLCRPLYSIFFHVYRWLHSRESSLHQILWESAKREFILAILFLDRCFLSWGRPNSLDLLATDASLKGAGACITNISAGKLTTVREQGWGELSASAAIWTPTLNRQWNYGEHINVLEFRALILALQPWLEEWNKVHQKWNLFTDSQVILGVVKKGRSSSYMLGCLMRRFLAICLHMNASFAMSWVASANNPADVLSRVFFPEEEASLAIVSTPANPRTGPLYDTAVCKSSV